VSYAGGMRYPNDTRVSLAALIALASSRLGVVAVDGKISRGGPPRRTAGTQDLDGAVVTSAALHTVRANLDWLVTDKKAHYIAGSRRSPSPSA
jgi:hypothetical protein